MKRRQFSQALATTIGSYALLRSLFAQQAFARVIDPVTQPWLLNLNYLSRDLKQEAISPRQWQIAIDELYNRISLPELLSFVDFDRLAGAMALPDVGVGTRSIPLPGLTGLPEGTAFFAKLFGLKKDRAIIPHGHKNMASCHYVLQGDFHLRQYDKVDEDDEHLLIVRTIDAMVGPGSHSSISDDSNNVHWLIAKTDSAFTFDVIITGLNQQRYQIHNIDPIDAAPTKANALRAKKLTVNDALMKYGKVIS